MTERSEAIRLLTELHGLPESSPQRQVLRDKLVEMHMALVEYLARRFSGRNEPLPDLVQVGAIGLLKSIDRFDPDRGLEFSTYATPTILGEIKRYFRDSGWLVHVPRRAQELQATLATSRAELSQELQRAPTVAELAERTGLREEDIVEALDAARGYSGVPLDALTDENHGGNAAQAMLAQLDERFEQVERREMLRPAMEALARARAPHPAAPLRGGQVADRDRHHRRCLPDAGLAPRHTEPGQAPQRTDRVRRRSVVMPI